MLAFAALVSAVLGRVVEKDTPFTAAEYWTLWEHFQTLDGHTGYSTMSEHTAKFDVFKTNMDAAREFNAAGEYSYKLGVTIFADLTPEEFKAYLAKSSGTKPLKGSLNAGAETYNADDFPAPLASVDWRTEGYVTPIKNQGSCGSCWAFSTTGSIEGQNFKVNGKLSSFSEQELVDCGGATGNQGCNGGLMDDAFKFVETDGLCYESAYPYTGVGATCAESSCTAEVKVTAYTDIPQGDTSSLMSACSNNGPISIAVDANMFWQLYTKGVFTHKCNGSLDHGVLLVGYVEDSYYIVKNSWGSGWGEDGYIRLTAAAGANTCGLANSASYPTVEKK